MNHKTAPPGHATQTPGLSAAQRRVIDQVVAACQGDMVIIARSLMRQYHTDPLGLAPEGAVNEAMLRVWQAVTEGTMREIANRDDLMTAFRHVLEQFLQDRRRWESAQKRGGPARTPMGGSASRRVEADLDAIPSDAAGPDPPVDAADEIERMMNLLDGHDPSLRKIADLASSGITNREIAAELGLSISTVERRLRKIRSIWDDYDPDPRRRKDPHGRA